MKNTPKYKCEFEFLFPYDCFAPYLLTFVLVVIIVGPIFQCTDYD